MVLRVPRPGGIGRSLVSIQKGVAAFVGGSWRRKWGSVVLRSGAMSGFGPKNRLAFELGLLFIIKYGMGVF